MLEMEFHLQMGVDLCTAGIFLVAYGQAGVEDIDLKQSIDTCLRLNDFLMSPPKSPEFILKATHPV